jgi:hypothetical protein
MRTRLAALDTAFEDIVRAKLAADLFDVDRLALTGEARVARDHGEQADARQGSDDVLDNTVGEIFLLGGRHLGSGTAAPQSTACRQARAPLRQQRQR